jgi:ATP-binding cassette subfamily B protein
MKGFSMFPTLRPGDRGLIEKCDFATLKKGDIVVFRLDLKFIAHRLIDIRFQDEKPVYITKGDNNSFIDQTFDAAALVGKITSVYRGSRTIKMNSLIMKVRKTEALYFSKLLIPHHHLILRWKQRGLNVKNKFSQLKNNLTIVVASARKEFSINAIISVLQGITPFIILVCVKKLIDVLTHGSLQNIHQQKQFILWLVLTALFFLISGLLSELRDYFSEKLAQSVTKQVYNQLHEKHEELDLSTYENPSQQDQLHRAVQEASFRPVKILNELLVTFRSVASGLFLVGLFVLIRWYLIIVLIIAILPGIVIRIKYSRERYKLKDSQNTREREMYYFNRILTGFPFAKELRLFGYGRFFRHKFHNLQNELFDEKITLRRSEMKWGIYAQIFSIGLIFISLAFVSYLNIQGVISIGTVVLFFFAFQRGYAVLNDFFRSVTQLMEDNTFLDDFIQFLKMPVQKTLIEEPKSFSLQCDIRFENVSFRYESSQRNALKSINIVIPAGKTVAFVGANGSGKTTLIKLLCGFYSPDSGQILYDGKEIRELQLETLRQNITAVFQDFALYNITASQNIALGNINADYNEKRMEEAARKAGMEDVLKNLPNGFHTLLGNLFQGGEELSIGQWQKMAIARAFYRDSTLILMDEPSSALDAASEMQIINNLKTLSYNKTAVIVSHRLSTVQWADLIYFFDKGEVKESGSHNELMNKKGLYYNLYQTASNFYC